MNILLAALVGLTIVSFGLAYAFLSPDPSSTVILKEGLSMSDSIEVSLNGNA